MLKTVVLHFYIYFYSSLLGYYRVLILWSSSNSSLVLLTAISVACIVTWFTSGPRGAGKQFRGSRFHWETGGVCLLKYSSYEVLWQLTRVILNVELNKSKALASRTAEMFFLQKASASDWTFFFLAFTLLRSWLFSTKKSIFHWKIIVWKSSFSHYITISDEKYLFTSLPSTSLIHSLAAIFMHKHMKNSTWLISSKSLQALKISCCTLPCYGTLTTISQHSKMRDE